MRDIDEWMIRNLVVISSRFHLMPDIGHITVGSECIAPSSDSVHNLGVQFDTILHVILVLTNTLRTFVNHHSII